MEEHDSCHVRILPKVNGEVMRLVRHGKQVHKFKIVRDETMERFIEQYDETKVQLEIELVMNYVINMSNGEFPPESTIQTTLFGVKIRAVPWPLSDKVCFIGPANTYSAGTQQFVLSIDEKSDVPARDFLLGEKCSTPRDYRGKDRIVLSKERIAAVEQSLLNSNFSQSDRGSYQAKKPISNNTGMKKDPMAAFNIYRSPVLPKKNSTNLKLPPQDATVAKKTCHDSQKRKLESSDISDIKDVSYKSMKKENDKLRYLHQTKLLDTPKIQVSKQERAIKMQDGFFQRFFKALQFPEKI